MDIFSRLPQLVARPEYMAQPPVWFYGRILVGAGEMLTPRFAQKYKITHVINCARPEDSPAWFRRSTPTWSTTKYVCLDAEDDVNVNILGWYGDFEKALGSMLREPGSQTIFVHCRCGINRSAFLALTYITKNYGLPFDETMKSLKRQRHCMFTNSVFMKQTKEFVNGRVQSEKDS